MHKLSYLIFATAFACGAAGCSKTSSQTCPAGQAETDGSCRCLCENHSDCAACGGGLACDARGVCLPGTGPVITAVTGNDPSDPGRVLDGLIVVGTLLAQASFELRAGAQVLPLTPRSGSDSGAELILPQDIRSGSYTLVATNQAGSAQVPVSLVLPELDGQTLLARINSEATGELVVARLPVGTIAGTVAAGDHTHGWVRFAFDSDAELQTGSLSGGAGVANGLVTLPPTELGSGEAGELHATYDLELPGGTYHVTRFIIDPGVTVVSRGDAPLVVRASEAIVIGGTLDLAGEEGEGLSGVNSSTSVIGIGVWTRGGRGGAGGFAGGGASYFDVERRTRNGYGPGGGRGGGEANGGGGGGGGGSSAAGGSGANATVCAVSGSGGAGGALYSDASLSLGLVGGSGGGSGGFGTGANSAGSGGGGGGGAVLLVAPTITISGRIDARGGQGGVIGQDNDGGTGGGGAGGTVWARGDTVTISGQLLATGGAGGVVYQPASCTGGAGGSGASGRIRIDAANLVQNAPTYSPLPGLQTSQSPGAVAWESPALQIAGASAAARFLRVDLLGEDLERSRVSFRTAPTSAGLATATYRRVSQSGGIAASAGHAFGQMRIEAMSDAPLAVDAVLIDASP